MKLALHYIIIRGITSIPYLALSVSYTVSCASTNFRVPSIRSVARPSLLNFLFPSTYILAHHSDSNRWRPCLQIPYQYYGLDLPVQAIPFLEQLLLLKHAVCQANAGVV